MMTYGQGLRESARPHMRGMRGHDEGGEVLDVRQADQVVVRTANPSGGESRPVLALGGVVEIDPPGVKTGWPREPGPLVLVRWYDPTDLGGAWLTAKKAVTHKPCTCLTIGWLVHEDEDYVVVVSSLAGKHMGTGMTIPVGCIEDMEVQELQ